MSVNRYLSGAQVRFQYPQSFSAEKVAGSNASGTDCQSVPHSSGSKKEPALFFMLLHELLDVILAVAAFGAGAGQLLDVFEGPGAFFHGGQDVSLGHTLAWT